MAKILLIFLAAFCLSGSACTQVELSSAPASQMATPVPSPTIEPPVDEVVVADVPKATWEPIFHEAIDERTKIAGIRRLRNLPLEPADIEVRIWVGFGLTRLEGIVLSRKQAKWSGQHLYFEWETAKSGNRTDILNIPISGWDKMWRSLLDHKLLVLPDARSIKCEAMYNDGFSYVVELKKGASYRTYMYDNPMENFENRCKEADEILAISNIVADEFGIAGFRQALRK